MTEAISNNVKDNKAFQKRTQCFVIQPFGETLNSKTGKIINNDEVYSELTKLNSIQPNFPIALSRADIGHIKKEDLHEHVITRLRESDFCIADLTGQNPNVLYEAGFAKGIGLQVIFICHDPSVDIPTDLKKYLWVKYSMESLSDLTIDISAHLDRIKEEIRILQHKKLSKVEYFESRSDANIRGKIMKAKTNIDILQTNLVTIATDYLQQIRENMRANKELTLHLLTLNPQSIFVNYRGQQVGFGDNIGLYREELDGNLKSVHFALREFGNRVRIKVYDDFPNQIVFFFDEEILACVVSATGRSRENCAFFLDSKLPGAQRTFIDHFKYLWEKKSVDYPLPM